MQLLYATNWDVPGMTRKFPLFRAARWSALLAAGQLTAAQAGPAFLQDGEAGFVVSHIEYALSDDAELNGACPSGMTGGLQEIFAASPGGKRGPDESDEQYVARVQKGTRTLSTTSDGRALCMHPEAGQPDPYFRTVQRSDIAVFGIDLDGEISNSDSKKHGTCAHDDFSGRNGEPGIDNQFYRVVGCSRSFQSTGMSNSFSTEMLTGSWGILLRLRGVDDIANDDDVEVGLYYNTDPIKLSPGREPLAYASYIADSDSRFRGETRGRISNGVLTTEPVDVRFRHVVNSMVLERFLRDARLQVTLSEQGELEGYLSGYTPVEAMYDQQFGYRNGKTGSGELAPLKLRSGSATGAAFVLGHTCNGAYYALLEHADGHPDPATGECTSISTQYRIRAIPAFVLEDTDSPESLNPVVAGTAQ